MYQVKFTSAFKKGYKLMKKRNMDISLYCHLWMPILDYVSDCDKG